MLTVSDSELQIPYMKTTITQRITPKRVGRKGTLFPWIIDAARHLGCSRVLLFRVLVGQSPDYHNLVRGYHAFVSSKKKGGTK